MRKDDTMSITVLIAPSGFKESLPVDDVTRAIAKGVLDLRDVLFFLLTIAVWLLATAVVLDMKKAD